MAVTDILIADYDYELPAELIAAHPLAQRDACKLLVADRDSDETRDLTFKRLPELLPDGSVLVYNNTRVINARLLFRKASTGPQEGALIEIFCLEPEKPADYDRNFASTESCSWTCLVGNAKKWKQGRLSRKLEIDGRQVTFEAEMAGEVEGRARRINFSWNNGVTFSQVIEAAGVIPIPPYLERDTEPEDSADYQTVYNRIEGSVAAPTAGLHFTPELLDDIDRAGVKRIEVTLHVGAGTFQPVKADAIGDHPMHSEYFTVTRRAIEELRDSIKAGRKVIAVGTTSVRTLESLYQAGCLIYTGRWDGEVPQWFPYCADHPQLTAVEALDAILARLDKDENNVFIGATRLLIAPGFNFHVINGMVTNFHQPHSTLLLLIAAFLGGKWRELYNHAVNERYRFLSYGDACLFLER